MLAGMLKQRGVGGVLTSKLSLKLNVGQSMKWKACFIRPLPGRAFTELLGDTRREHHL